MVNFSQSSLFIISKVNWVGHLKDYIYQFCHSGARKDLTVLTNRVNDGNPSFYYGWPTLVTFSKTLPPSSITYLSPLIVFARRRVTANRIVAGDSGEN